MFDSIKTENPDFIVWLGDNPSHEVYAQTADGHKSLLSNLTHSLLKNHKGIGKVYPVVGNHEGLPSDHIDVTKEGHWMFEFLAELWSPWLTEESQESMRKYGRYVQLHPGTKLRVIGLNSFVQDAMNSYTWRNATDPMGELVWLNEVLKSIEDNKEKALIIGHYPPYNTFGNAGITYK